ncbi:MAG: ATP-binding protein, partial [Oceanobacter sp.]
ITDLEDAESENLTINQDFEVEVYFQSDISHALVVQIFYSGAVVLILIVLLFTGLFLLLRRWQVQSLMDLIRQIQLARQDTRDIEGFSSTDPDLDNLVEQLNTFYWQRNEQVETIQQDYRKTEHARMRAALIAEERARINEDLEYEITVRTAAEKQLSNVKALLDTILDVVPNALMALDKSNRILLCNRQAEKWLDASYIQLIGVDITSMIPELEEHLLNARILAEARPGEPIRIEKVELRSLIPELTTEIMIFPLSEEQPAATVVRIEDIRRRMKMEEVMVQSEKMLTVGGMAAGLAHEINNPLGAMLQNLQNLRRRLDAELPANQRAAEQIELDLESLKQYLELRGVFTLVDHIQQAGERAAKTIANMLNFSRHQASDRVPTQVNQLVTTAISLVQNESGFGRVQIQTELTEPLPEVPCIPGEIEQVLVNMIQNAMHALDDYVPPLGSWLPEINIRSWQEAGYVCLAIKDNGPGVDPYQASHIFEPFFTTKEVGKGTGLGLSVSYFIVTTHHGGIIRYQSANPHGACFIIRLPLIDL